jgi:HEAT repeat protein
VPALLEILQNDTDPNLRLRAVYALEDSGDERIVPVLIQLLNKKEQLKRGVQRLGVGGTRRWGSRNY